MGKQSLRNALGVVVILLACSSLPGLSVVGVISSLCSHSEFPPLT